MSTLYDVVRALKGPLGSKNQLEIRHYEKAIGRDPVLLRGGRSPHSHSSTVTVEDPTIAEAMTAAGRTIPERPAEAGLEGGSEACTASGSTQRDTSSLLPSTARCSSQGTACQAASGLC